MTLFEAIVGSTVGAALQRVSRRRSDRVAVTVVGRPPFGRPPNYFIPSVEHPSELRGAEDAGRTRNAHGAEYIAWVARNHGVPCGTSHFKLTVQCLGTANVALVGGRAVTDRLEDVSGIAVRHPSGGPIDIFHLRVALDSGTIECFPEGRHPGVHPPIPLDFQIAPQATERFDVYAHVGDEAVIWHLELDFVIDGKRVTKKVLQPSGERFTTVPLNYDQIVGTYYPTDNGWVAASDLF